MHIQEIVIDGFKSYAQRTVITGFDRFNAITGLNGSGKSNILDAICFVLGITNLLQVRVGNLSELVYKQGQAGITRASVTIVFDNSDPKGSPVGYEECSEITITRQVLIGGKSKYLVNGRVTSVGQVNNLFHSVQLNVNNPHFLIMQGRITKVLNMKADEILGLIEEAAGTRMYEAKRVNAINMIQKKQIKLDELNTILSEEITPTLSRLRNERQVYLKWSKNNADVERLQRFVIAAEYHAAKAAIAKGQSSVEELSEQADALSRQAQAYQVQIDEKVKEMDTLSSQMDLQGELGTSHKQAKAEEDKRLKELVKFTTAWQNCKAVVTRAEEDVQASQALIIETRQTIDAKKLQIKLDQEKSQYVKDELANAEHLLSQLMTEFQNMCAGISSGEGEDTRTLPDQISKAHNDANAADAKAKQATMKIGHLKKSLVSVEKDLKREEKAAEKLASSKAAAAEKLAAIEKKICGIDFSQTVYDELEKERGELEISIKNLKDTISSLSAQIQGRLAFDYTDPVRGFDRSRVKGVVAKLVNVPRKENATALEVVAGGKLFQVVVDEAITGKALLSRGKLQRRVTIIPLDKIQSKQITSSAINDAQKIGQQMTSTVYPAIELLTFNEEVRGAIEYVFGSSLVVEKPDAANKICDITHTRAVTLEGDVYDPSGTISGGSKDNFGNTLAHLSALATAQSELVEKEKHLQEVSSKVNSMRNNFRSFEKNCLDLEVAKAELESINKHISHTSYGMLLEKFNAMTTEIEEASAEAEAMSNEKETKWTLFNHLKEKETELTRQRESKLSGIDNQVTHAKKAVMEFSQKARDAESISQTLVMELDVLNAELSAANEAVTAAEKSYKKAQDTESDMEVKVAELKILCDNAKFAVVSIESKISSCSADLKRLSKEKTHFLKLMETAELESKKLSLEVAQMRKDSTSNSRFISNMLKKHTWIESEEHAFGVPGSEYDFEHSQLGEMKEQLKGLESEQITLSKNINKKVMGMIEKAEGEYTELLRKRKIVENDRKKIQAFIEELDIQKKSELQRTWVKVNNDFGSMFSILLPGASAKLEPPEGMEAWEGLEVKVAFGNVWKESLSELSGGQRSLLALSLILALLLFKPAPMYILDEVDAALDLSHTQNIGCIIRTHFAHSQFIVVSLKEGMFNNANVIFRTKFVDGVSTVTRTLGTGASMRSRPLLTNDENTSSNDNDKSSPVRKRVARSVNANGGGSATAKEN